MRDFICTIVMLCSQTGMAQEMLRGNVYDSNHTALAGAAIVMLDEADSTYIQGAVSKEDGSFSIARPQKECIIAASYLGHETAYMRPTGDSVVTIVLKENTNQLQGVTVRASRPVSQLTHDGFMFTVKGTPLAQSGSLNEILEQMPLVKKTSSGYEIMGKGEAVFYLNGHRVYNLSELESISSKDVRNVEIITSPGTQYDASVSSVIKINTASNALEGLSVNARSTWSQNRHSNWVEQLGIRYTKKRLTVYDDFKYRADNNQTWKDMTQTVFAETLWNEVSKEKEHRKQRTIENTAGFDYQLSDNNYIGGRYSLTFNLRNAMDMESANEITADGEHYDILNTAGEERGHKRPQHLFNLYYSGSVKAFKLNADIDYITNVVKTDNTYREESEADEDRTIDAVSEVKNRMMYVRASIAHKLFGGEATVGMEYRYTKRNDDYDNSNEYIPTSISLLKETQYSPFIDYSVLTRVGMFGLGVRLEKTRFKYYSDKVYMPEQSQSTTKVFPKFSWGIRLGALQAQLAYTTSINRPTYRQLSKNTLYGSRYTWQTGNPLLRPEYIHELSLQGVWRFLQFQAGYTDARNAIVYWATQQEQHSAVSVMSYKNLPSVKQIRVALVLSKAVGIWTPQLTVAMNKQFLHIDTDMGTYSMNSPIWIAKLSNSFKVAPTLYMFLTANYQSTGDYRNVHLNRHVWHMNFNMTKSFYKDRFSVQLKVSDIFRTNKDGNNIFNEQMVMNLLNRYDSRSVSVTLRYQFNDKTYKKHSHSNVDKELKRL